MAPPTSSPIIWTYSGPVDLTVGPGATRTEKALAYAAALPLPLLLAWLYFSGQVHWALWQFLLALPIAADLGAGMVANALNSTKRFYHTPPLPGESGTVRFAKNPLSFAALHIYPLIIGLVFGPWNWLYGLGWYALLLLASWVVARVPLYLQRPVAFAAVLLALTINGWLIAPPTGFEWLAPVLFLKIVAGHGVREEPYRPSPEETPNEIPNRSEVHGL